MKRTPTKPLYTIAAIRRYARKIAERFQPDKIILFGSYAWGEPSEDSDVDLFIIMPARNQIDQAIKIRLAIDAPFPLDLLVCKPREWRLRVADDESFIRQIRLDGKVLYEAIDTGLGQESRGRHPDREASRSKNS